MTATTSSTALAAIQPAFTDAERLALAGYRGLTREACTLDLRQFSGWCRARSLPLFAVRRADIETFARELEARGRARATIARRLCTIAGFCKYAVEEELLEHSPAAHVRRPRLDYESHATALDRNELGAILVAAGLGPPAESWRPVHPRRPTDTARACHARRPARVDGRAVTAAGGGERRRARRPEGGSGHRRPARRPGGRKPGSARARRSAAGRRPSGRRAAAGPAAR